MKWTDELKRPNFFHMVKLSLVVIWYIGNNKVDILDKNIRC